MVEGHFHIGEQGESGVLECGSRPGCSGIGRFLAGLSLAGPFKRLFHRKRALGHACAGARVTNGATPGAAGDGRIRIGACRNLLALALFHHPLGAGQCGVVLHRQRQNIRQGIGGGAWRFILYRSFYNRFRYWLCFLWLPDRLFCPLLLW